MGYARLDSRRFIFGITAPTLEDLPRVAGSVAVTTGVTVLLGWLLGFETAKSLIPGQQTIGVTTALVLVFMGFGMLLGARAVTGRDRRLAILPVLGAIGLIVVVGSAYLVGTEIGVDGRLFRESAGQVGTDYPNRMSAVAVISFLMAGTGLAAATLHRLAVLARALALGALAVAALNVLDFIFMATAPSLISDHTQMAITTALILIVLSIGTIGLLPGRGLPDALVGPSASARLARRLIVASLVVPVILAWLRLLGEARGLYDAHYGASLVVLGTFIFLTSVILWATRASRRIEAGRQAVIEERDRFFDVSIDMLATATADGTFVRLNPAWKETLGYDLDELMARPFIEFVHPDDVAATNREVVRQIDEGKSVLNFQNRYRHRDGSYRWLEWTSSPSADGALLYAVARDITERKLEEERLGAPALALARRRAEALDRIEATIRTSAFGPVYQPIVDLSSGAAVGYEALTRFSDGSRPDEMFAIALECDLGTRLETATLQAALAGARRLPSRTWLSLNVSPRLLADVAAVGSILALRSRSLVLEITEHETIEAYGPLRDAVRALGPDIRLAVDDAGAGVANFHHLVELRPDFVKIDASLVRGVDTDMSRQAVVAGILHFAIASHCQVIAEGLETDAELAMVTRLGVTLGQGYLLGRPAPADEWPRTDDPVLGARVRRSALRPAKGGYRARGLIEREVRSG